MDNLEVKAIVGGTPHMSLGQAERMTAFISERRIESILELGFRHGVSTCYMAAALARLGRGSIVTIDLEAVRSLTPRVEDLLERIGERARVEIHYEPTCYTWRLMRLLEEDAGPRFDLCYVDGAHSWFVDGFAFFLIDRLLKPGGWIIFDDVDWTYATARSLSGSEWVRSMPEDERTTPQIRKVYELLVRTHSSYHNFRLAHGWAYAQKMWSAPPREAPRQIVSEQIVTVERIRVGLGALIVRAFDRLRGN